MHEKQISAVDKGKYFGALLRYLRKIVIVFLTSFYLQNCIPTILVKQLLRFYRITETITGRVLQVKVFLQIFKKFTGKHLCQSFFYHKVAG